MGKTTEPRKRGVAIDLDIVVLDVIIILTLVDY